MKISCYAFVLGMTLSLTLCAQDRTPTSLGGGIAKPDYAESNLFTKGQFGVQMGSALSRAKTEIHLENSQHYQSESSLNLDLLGSELWLSAPAWSGARVGILNPIFNIEVDQVALKDVPVYLMNQRVNVKIEGSFHVYSKFMLTYTQRINASLTVTARLDHHNLKTKISAFDKDLDNHLLTVSGYQHRNNIDLGLHYKINSILRLALQTDIVRYTRTQLGYQVLTNEQATSQTDTQTSWKQMAFNRIHGALSYQIFTKHAIHADLIYTRVGQQQRVSLRDLVNKPLDNSDTLSPILAYQFRINDHLDVELSGRYQPAAVGIGRKTDGDDRGYSGYGLWDVYLYDKRPSEQIALGVSWSRALNKRIYARVRGGVAWVNTNVGVPEKGENLGSYQISTVRIPIELALAF